MNNTQFAISLLLIVLLVGVAASYYITTRRMLQMRREMDKLQAKARVARASATLRNERARCHLELQSLEAQITVNERVDLSPEELDMLDRNQQTIKNCVDALKRADEWLGLPFDLEWRDMLERLPRLNALYRASLDNSAQAVDTINAGVPGVKGGSVQQLSPLDTTFNTETVDTAPPTKQSN